MPYYVEKSCKIGPGIYANEGDVNEDGVIDDEKLKVLIDQFCISKINPLPWFVKQTNPEYIGTVRALDERKMEELEPEEAKPEEPENQKKKSRKKTD